MQALTSDWLSTNRKFFCMTLIQQKNLQTRLKINIYSGEERFVY